MNRFNELPPHAETRPQDASQHGPANMASLIETAPSAPSRSEGSSHIMKALLGDLPFKNSRRVYLAIKLAVLALGVLLALHFLWGVV